MNKRPIFKIGLLASVLVIAVWPLYHAFNPKPYLSVTFVGYTNVAAGKLPRAVFAVTNVSHYPLQRWGWEEYSNGRLQGIAQPPPSTLQPGQGELIEISPSNLPNWRLAVLSTDSLKEKWNQTLISTPYVDGSQWDQLWFNRSYSPWIPGPLSVPTTPQ